MGVSEFIWCFMPLGFKKTGILRGNFHKGYSLLSIVEQEKAQSGSMEDAC